MHQHLERLEEVELEALLRGSAEFADQLDAHAKPAQQHQSKVNNKKQQANYVERVVTMPRRGEEGFR